MSWSRSLGTMTFVLVGAWACGGGDSGSDGAASGGGAPPAATTPSAASGGGSSANLPAGVTAAMVDRGRELFNGAGSCFACHGQDGTNGALAPDLADDEWLNVDDGTFESLVEVIDTGVESPREFPGVMLPRAGMALTDEDVEALAAYVWSISNAGS